MSSIKKGSIVRQVVPVITGQVVEKKFNDDTDEFEYRVTHTLPDGEHGERWFKESEIEDTGEFAETTEQAAGEDHAQ